jgi:manganese-dependent inorganic pyrophosphatase
MLDRMAAEALAKIAGIDVESFAMEMFEAGSDLKSKSAADLFYQDFKKFSAGDIQFGVGQITALDPRALKNIHERLSSMLENAKKEHGLDMIFFMMTDILEESTILLCVGDGALEKVQEASGTEKDGAAGLMMPGVVSRKKQIIPLLIKALS